MKKALSHKTALKIIENGCYELPDKKIVLPTDYRDVTVYSPEELEKLLYEMPEPPETEICNIEVTNEDSFEAAARYKSPLVMNFANSVMAGGGFLFDATAQEESLCMRSTLYASISSKKAKEMYEYNRTHISPTASHYMLISPNVYIFADKDGKYLENTQKAAVITVPAPNRNGLAFSVGKGKLNDVMLERIRYMLCAAFGEGYKDLVLGAWGCGAFGNDPRDVSGYFRQILEAEKFGKYFDNVCFAVYGKTTGKNYTVFKNTFADIYSKQH